MSYEDQWMGWSYEIWFNKQKNSRGNNEFVNCCLNFIVYSLKESSSISMLEWISIHFLFQKFQYFLNLPIDVEN